VAQAWSGSGPAFKCVYSGMPASGDLGIEGLFQLPLDRFTEARNELAARLRAEGKREAAAAAKALPKPPASAWAVNQVYWKARGAFDTLIRAGVRLAEAQRRGVGGDELRDAIRERRAAVQAALRHAEEELASGGHGASPQVLRRVSSTLEALASGGAEGRAGTLTEDLQAPGFEALAGLLPDPAPSTPKTKNAAPGQPSEEQKARAAAEATRLKRAAEEAEAALGQARERLQGARSELEEARRRLQRAQERVEQSERAVLEAEARSAEAKSLAGTPRPDA